MDLFLNQLVYTSFTYVGFALLASQQVPLHIQQIFLKQVVYRYWNAFERENHTYRAAYVLQITAEDWLFGWVYNDEWDDVDRSHIPHFICYHLTGQLYAFRIEKVCACLQKGPLEVVNRHSFSNSLEPLIIKDVGSYQEAKPGVVIPWEIRQQMYMNLKQGKLTDIFILGKEQESLFDLSLQVQPLASVTEQHTLIDLSLQVQPQEQVPKDKNVEHHSLQPLVPVTEQHRIIERSLSVQPQEQVTKDKNVEHHSLRLDKNSILLLGISFGIITSLAVTVLIYVFLFMTSVRNQPTRSPSNNTLSRTTTFIKLPQP